ncbi:membrane-associated guanylate kinase, WW and PDZ domain-containing protein 1 isoform X2 [Lepeophtheirus salmonis]|uniref:membrane-associated guanylate kinase, WW and PDZ domain-containing protein 1 isoform X2 n=1 Tax=Lepeophtheirus salmonis TaxID=72036 RepID=UPI003AF3C264
MCSVIEIKNSEEYYIHYKSPESMEKSKSKKEMGIKNEEEVTSDRGSSMSEDSSSKLEDNNGGPPPLEMMDSGTQVDMGLEEGGSGEGRGLLIEKPKSKLKKWSYTNGAIAADLRHYLNTRFPKGGVDHDLQNTIRENLYLRTVPVTTRTPRPGEKNGVDYTFLSKEEFIALEKSGELLESGIFDGNHYGTPRPKDSGGNSPHSRGSSSNDSSTSAPKLFPGAHPSSEGKRKRNRSNVEAMSAKHDTSHHSESNKRDQEHEPQDPLGPLPPHWEKAYTEKGEPYFIDHLSGTSHWLDPRLSRIQKKRPEDCSEDELPFGWERIDDPHYGTYYIDHVNRRTQYENPVLVARAVNQSADAIASPNDGTSLPIPPGPGTFPRTKKTQSGFKWCLPCLVRIKKADQVVLTKSSTSLTKTRQNGCHHLLSPFRGNYRSMIHLSKQKSNSVDDLNVRSCLRRSSTELLAASHKKRSFFRLNNCSKRYLLSLTSNLARTNSNKTKTVKFALPSTEPNSVKTTSALSNFNGRVVATMPTMRDSDGGLVRFYSSTTTTSGQMAFLPCPTFFASTASHCYDPNCFLKYGAANFSTSFSFHSSECPDLVSGLENSGKNYVDDDEEDNEPAAFFTRDPNQLRGERIRTQLVKSARGLGFTIVGGDDNVEEFLQIKSVVPNGPAWLDGGLKTGDVLVYVNSTCVLGFTHHDMVTMFQSISTGDIVQLEICRGYPLPFDPDDPNTEIVTTVAVTSPEQGEWAQELEQLQQRQADVQSMPDLSGTSGIANIAPRPGSADLLGDIYPSSKGGSNSDSMSVQITKGGMGFGFTIADSAYGQKVKKILDRARCKNLNEGDVLIEINDINVRNMTHSEVVQVLKNCSRGQEATITVQRGLLSSKESSPSKNKYKKDSFKPKSGFLFRSKTPTAELYSTQEKEKVPNRPKTPLVDTRHMASRSKTPTAAFNEPFSRNDFTRASMGGGSAANNSISTQLGERMDAALRLDNSDNYSRAHSPGRELDTNYGSYSGQHTRGDYQYHHSLLPQENNTTAYGQSEYGGGPYSPSKVGSNDNGNFNGYNNNNPTSSGYDPSYGYTRRTGPPLTGSLPRGRKESTSFEHSEPLPGNLTRWPRPERRATDMLEIAVTLHRQDSGFGFRIVGGTEEGSQVSIGHIVPGGAADLDGRLFSGDEIVAVDNNSVLNSSHHQVVGLMGTAAQNGKVTLTIRRRIYQQDGNGRATETYPYDVAVDRRENEGFGFVIISSVSRSGSTIGRIIPGSPAERCGRLHIGDRILAVNHVDINYMHHGEIVNLIKDSGYSVVLTVGPPIDETSSTTSASHRSSTSSMVTAQATPTVLPPTDSTGSTASVSSNVDPRSVIAGYTYNPYQQQQQQPPPPPPPQQQQQQPPYSPPQQSSQMELYDNSYQTQSQNELVYSYQDQQDQELNRLELDDQYYAVELRRGSRGFGFSIRGGREFQCMPLFVLRIAMDGPAASDGRLRVGDQIIEINGNNTKNMTHSEAIELIKSGGGVVRLLVRRGKMPPAALMEQLSPMAPTPVPSIMSSQQSNALNRPMSAMSQPTTNLGHYSLQQQQQLPTTHPNGNLHNYDNYNYLPNGHLLNGPVSQSSPRDQLYGWQQQQQQQISSLHQQHQS